MASATRVWGDGRCYIDCDTDLRNGSILPHTHRSRSPWETEERRGRQKGKHGYIHVPGHHTGLQRLQFIRFNLYSDYSNSKRYTINLFTIFPFNFYGNLSINYLVIMSLLTEGMSWNCQ
jgi:hypothetical protein